MNSWPISMLAAGVCSAVAILLIRDLPKFAGGIPSALVVGIYMILGGLVVLAVSATALQGGALSSVKWPSFGGMLGVAAIGILLAMLEFFFVIGARRAMPLPDAMIVYDVTSLSVVSIASVVIFGETMNWSRSVGVGMGVVSMFLLLQPAGS